MSIISAKSVDFAYEDEVILKNINCEINAGDYIGIIGGNGVGKSTLIKLFLGELKATSGSIKTNYKNIGYIPQNAGQISKDFPATVKEIVASGLYRKIGLFRFLSKDDKKKIDEVLDIVGMSDYKNRLIGKLSGGQQQRVALAKMLISEPEIIFLDEPQSGIDKATEKMLYDLLKRQNQEKNLTILMITHDITGIEKSVNRVFFLENTHLTEIPKEETCLHSHTHHHIGEED